MQNSSGVITVPQECKSLLSGAKEQDNVVVDSGSTLHLVRDRTMFKEVTSRKVRIHGVAGATCGWFGTLKDNKLGTGMSAVLFEKLPVRMLLSTRGLKKNHWETHFEITGDYLKNTVTGEIINLVVAKSGLPCIEEEFPFGEGGLVCQACDSNEDQAQVLISKAIPRSIARATRLSLTRRAQEQ